MEFERVERTTVRLADFVYRQLFDAVVAGQVPPGERLVQEVIAEEMNVSRTPVREALLRLESEGILESSERGGFVVRSLDLDEATMIYELRAALEGFAARLVAVRPDAEGLDLIRKAIAAAEAGATDLEEGYELNRRVHRSIAEATRNPMLIDAVDGIWGRSQAFRMFAKLHASDIHFLDSEPSHRDVLQAIEMGDGPAAQESMTAHILAGLDAQLGALRAAVASVGG
jgi:DNA-binding GntR family transcriptional regulator